MSHTGQDENPWFEVDLGADYKVTSITVLNRNDGAYCGDAPTGTGDCSDRFKDPRITLTNDSGKLIAVQEADGTIGADETYQFGMSFSPSQF